ncbi:MAG: RNA polymerase sigma factor [Cytophagales bacterium]|nr:RNA polymerase sigma factor [Bernardetiaceae bacterium]MDW8204247.1 RNA polymerase sigma factor [Cytophagales bacterium]
MSAVAEDTDILSKFKQEESKNWAFDQLMRKYQQRIYMHIRKMVIDHNDADDLTQEVFVKVWHHLDTFREDAQLYTWLYRIASNECLNFLNKKRRRYFIPLYDVAKELATKLDHQHGCTGEEIQLKLQKALLRLPDKQRLVFNLRYYDELTYEDIANITGTSVGALKASYHHAVKKIEEYLAKNAI